MFYQGGIAFWFLKLLLPIKKKKKYKHSRTERMGKLTTADEGCQKVSYRNKIVKYLMLKFLDIVLI